MTPLYYIYNPKGENHVLSPMELDQESLSLCVFERLIVKPLVGSVLIPVH